MKRREIPWGRITAEFIAILVGVTLALLADDWREYRHEREDERLVLEEILTDLETDSIELATQLTTMRSTERAVLWTLRNLSEPLPLDSAIQGVAPMFFYDVYEQVRSGYSGLRDSGQLSIVRDRQLRRHIIEYYEVTQPWMRHLHDTFMVAFAELVDVFGPYIRMVPDSTGDDFMQVINPALRRTWEEITADYRVISKVEWIGTHSSNFASRIELALNANSELRGQIREELE